MNYNYLGNTGLLVSSLCLGTMTFAVNNPPSGMPIVSQNEAHAFLDKFAAMGGNFIDTADMYSQGESEIAVGNWLVKQDRTKFVIATKARWPTGDGPNQQGLSRAHLTNALNASLKRLQTDYVDLFFVHAWDSGTPLKETLSTLNDFVRSGKVRYIGASNFSAWQLQKSFAISEKYGYESFCCLQQQYSLLCRETEHEHVPCAIDNGISILPWSPLKGGWLSGRYKVSDKPPTEGRIAWSQAIGWPATNYDNFNNEHTWAVLSEVEKIAAEVGKSVAQVSLRWLMQKQVVPSVIIGARTFSQLEDNLGAATFELSDEQMTRLDNVSQLPLPYPYDLALLHGASRNRH